MANFSFLVIVVSAALLASFVLCQDDCTRCDLIRCRDGKTCIVNKTNHRPECVQCPFGCPKILLPVCGCDGKTYSNFCDMKVAACEEKRFIVMKHEGRCKDNCSRCDLTRCSEVETCTVNKATHRPECVRCPGGCTEEYFAVCGCDNKTYDNRCYLKLAACEAKRYIVMKHEGRCKNNSRCDGISCPSGKSCDPKSGKCICNTVCIALYDPVCGSDGKTYGNSCELGVAACQTNTNITIAYWGECGTKGR